MDCPRVCVIDNSASIRETIAIILADAYVVCCLTPQECIDDPSQLEAAQLLVVADDALSSDAVAALARGSPVLWLQTGAAPPAPLTQPSATIPRSFTPGDLRARVRALLSERRPRPPPSTPGRRPVIDYPLVPQDVTVLVRRAAATSLPVLVCGEPGTGKARLARAINTLGHDRFVSVSATSCNHATLQRIGGLAPGDLTVFVNELASVDSDGQQLLLELLECGGFRSSAGWHSVRLVCATSRNLEELARVSLLDQDLFYRLSVLPITLPPLRERTDDIPVLVDHLSTEFARLSSTEPVSFTPRAIERLVRYLWFGNLAELEAVLMRTVALTPGRVIDVDDLLFGYGRIVPRSDDARPAAEPNGIPDPATTKTVDLVINELAHEFKNPMVTIKTVAQHLERLLGDETGRQQVARLTGEAVERMDRALENLLQFTRFRTPTPQAMPLTALLTPSLNEHSATFGERRVEINYQAPKRTRVYVDGAQITYAFDNLLRVILRLVAEGQTLSIHPLDSDTGVVFEVPGRHQPMGGRLSEFLDTAHAGEAAPLPLGFVFAKALIERNAGRIDTRTEADSTVITVRLPSRDESAPGNGKTASSHS